MKLQAHHIRAAKGQRRLVQINVSDPDQARAAEAVGIDIVVNGYRQDWPRLRIAAPDTHFCFSLRHGDHASRKSVLKGGFDALAAGADSVYCSLSPRFIEVLAREGIPVCAHAGLVPQKARLTGMRGFGKTAAEAQAVFQAVKDFESAGAVMVELECLAAAVTALITQATTLSTVSIGSGAGADIQYLFGCDILGEPGRKPRHARAWDDFAAEYARLQDRRQAAFASFRNEVLAGSYPAPQETVAAPPGAVMAFAEWLAQNGFPAELPSSAPDGPATAADTR
jgi:3-methyl-2-oxobutanoate hydroxymethyltransferase